MNKQATAERQIKVEEREENEEDLKFNPKRCAEILQYLMDSPEPREMMDDIADMTQDALYEKYKEGDVRDFLKSFLVITGGGSRASVVSRMTIKELKDAKEEDGIWVTKIKNHKVFGKGKYGTTRLAFCIPRLYVATIKYVITYKEDCGEDNLVFTSSKGRELDAKYCSNFIKRNYLAGFLTGEEMRTFTPSIWHHAWANWAVDHPDDAIGKIAVTVMCHSEETRSRHYLVKEKKAGGRFAKAIMKRVVGEKEKGDKYEGGKDEELNDEEKAFEEVEDENGEKDETEQDINITPKDKKILKDEVYRNGMPPKSLDQKKVLGPACRRNEAFRNVYKKLIKKRGTKRKANNTLHKMVIPKKKKQEKKIEEDLTSEEEE